MKKALILSLALLAVAGGATAGYFMLRPPPPAWTTSSPRALAAFEQGLEDLSKIYRADARRHFLRALELDPDFVAAKIYLGHVAEKEERERLRAELEAADGERLNPEERFLLAYHLAGSGEKGETAGRDRQAIVDEHLRQNPRSFFGLVERCELFWEAERWDPAEECYQRLIELHPNWVKAHNSLGYIAMAEGRFSEAEERFGTYRYIAPDQANPHDSLAELLLLLGRYEEAEASLAEAIRIKPDFCHAYDLLAHVGLFSGRFELVERAIGEAASFAACEPWSVESACAMRGRVRYLAGDPEGAWQELDGECLERRRGYDLFAHRAAVMTGRGERAVEMERALQERRDQAARQGRPVAADHYRALLAHMSGVRAFVAGDFAAAGRGLAAADELFAYWSYDRASLKMWNRLNLVHAYEENGEAARAEALRRKIEAVNPRIARELLLDDFAALAAGG